MNKGDEYTKASCVGKVPHESRYVCERNGSYRKNNGKNNGKHRGVRSCYKCSICGWWHCGFDMSAPSKKRPKIVRDVVED